MALQRVSHWHGAAANHQGTTRRRVVVACLCTVSAAVAVLLAARQDRTAAQSAGAKLLMQHEDIAGKEAERAEAKKLESIEDPAGGSTRTREQMESTQRPLRAGNSRTEHVSVILGPSTCLTR